MKQLTAVFGFLLLATLVGIMLPGLNPVSAASPALAPTGTPADVVAPAATPVVKPTNTSIPPTATAVVQPTVTLPKPTATQVVTPTAKTTTTVTPTAVVTPTATVTKTPAKAPTATPTKPKAVAPRAGLASALSTSFSAQNMDASTTSNLTGTFYDTTGTAYGSGVTCSILPFFSCVVDQRATGGGLDGTSNWQGSVILSSNTLLATIVNEYGGNMGALGQDFRYDTYNGTSSTDAATTIMLPQGLRQVVDTGMGSKSFSSLIAVQNTSAFPATIHITYYQVSGGTLVRDPAAIPAGASAFFDLTGETGLPIGWLGPIMITSDQAIAVTINQNASGALSAYRGFLTTSANATLYFPQVLYAVDDANTASQWGTAISVLVADQTSSTVRVTYDDGINPPFTDTKTAAPYALFDARFDMPRLGKTRFYGTAKVEALTSGKTLFAIINAQTNYNSSKGVNLLTATHFATADGKTTVFAPQVMRRYYDAGSGVTWSTSVNGRFLGGATATINYTYYKSDGTTTSGSYVPSGTNFLIDQVYDSHISDGQRGAMVLTCTQPFAITVNTTGQSPSGDGSGVYIGVGQ